ncbi:Alpha-1,6-mannosyltransferase Och1 [Tolypocladium paradoxum]|uniref:Alpha-1,6-mannosyltransferase Och1 n=1 Tax=Tolypocladium paradoxum TaxID=94208 RepID=A0A2S4KNU1_9HYPO|nr:Alpha-1,6-mannosyltransferase Och1 [Tolypocladium paradoxum]
MSEAQQEQSFPLLGPVITIMSSTFRHSKSKNRTLKVALSIAVWLTMLVALLHYTIYGRLVRPKEPTIHDNTHQHEPSRSLLPRKIWQIYLAPPNADKSSFEIDAEQVADAASWVARNPDYEYVLMGDKGAEEFIQQNFKKGSTLSTILRELKNTGIKSDLLRYLILSIKGGVYSDIDTEALKPIDRWVPEMHRKAARAVVGVEFDRLDGSDWGEVHPDLQFCQWTIAAAPGHALFRYMAGFVVSALEAFVREHNTTFAALEATSSDVMKLTGPTAWTDAVFQQLQRHQPELTSVRDLSGLTEPKLFGDVLVLPIDGFGMGQLHSNSTNDGSVPEGALVRHKFRGSWRFDGSSR